MTALGNNSFPKKKVFCEKVYTSEWLQKWILLSRILFPLSLADKYICISKKIV